jgi:hypothetical protein
LHLICDFVGVRFLQSFGTFWSEILPSSMTTALWRFYLLPVTSWNSR